MLLAAAASPTIPSTSSRRRDRSLMTAALQAAVAQEARADAQWLAKPDHARLLSPPAHARLAGDTRHQPVLSLENWLHVSYFRVLIGPCLSVSVSTALSHTQQYPTHPNNNPTAPLALIPTHPNNTQHTHPTIQQRRGWSAAAAAASSGSDATKANAIAPPGLRVLSHLLSYPLTLGHYLAHICPSPPQQAALVMLGARAEATLPSLWWRELLCYHGGGGHSSPLNLGLHMVGPELAAAGSGKGSSRGEQVRLATDAEASAGESQQGGGELTLFRHRGLYHELLAATEDGAAGLPPKPAAFVAFNPGFGHPNLSERWVPTLDAALLGQQSSPCSPMVLWTAHSQADQDRDLAFLDAHFAQRSGAAVDWLLAPMANPFGSRKRVAGGVGEEQGAVVQANQFVGVFRVRRL